MNLDRLNSWLALLANLGVVAGLIALVAELNYSSRLAETEAYQYRINEMQQANIEIAISSDLSQLIEKFESEGVGSLSPSELRRVRAWETGVQLRMQGQYFQYQQGFLDKEIVDRTINSVANSRFELWEDLGLDDNFQNPQWYAEVLERRRQLSNAE